MEQAVLQADMRYAMGSHALCQNLFWRCRLMNVLGKCGWEEKTAKKICQ